MCGITGFWDTSKQSTEQELEAMSNTLFHRGPDDEGLLFKPLDHGVLGLGHRRLSIIELSQLGHQPMQWQQFSIVYNGEIYNFREIQKELLQLGHIFKSNSDTEVILHAFGEWGEDCVHRFIGMFAFCIFDAKKEELLLCRDRAGVKPLFWSWDGACFLFASELKAFHKHSSFRKELSKAGLALYMAYGYVPGSFSIYEGVYKLKPGHWLKLKLHKNEDVELKPYWQLGDYYR